MKSLTIATFLALFLSALTGCAQMFTSKTEVSVETTDGVKVCKASYVSDKEQEKLVAEICGGKIRTARAGTLESVVEGVTALQMELVTLMNKLADGAKMAGS